MRKHIIILLMAALLLTSCTNSKSQETMKNLESANQLLQEQIESLENENQLLKKEHEELNLEVSSLNEKIGEKDAEIDRLQKEVKMLEKSQSFTIGEFKFHKRKIREVDLNNDGEKEFIKLEYGDDKYFRLSINNISIVGAAENIDNNFKIVDLKSGDNIKEIAISELGSDKDPKTTFYSYCVHNILFVGKINGHINDIKIKGDGSLITSANGRVLHSWTYPDKYVLNSDHILVNEPKDFYEMNHKVKVLKSIPLLKSTTETEMVAALTVGEEATLIASDNKRWCQVKKENGIKGWFEIEDFDKIKRTNYKASEVFEGLNIGK